MSNKPFDFGVPGPMMAGVTAFTGGVTPPDGYYEVKIDDCIEYKDGTDPSVGNFVLSTHTGHTGIWDRFDVPYVWNGQQWVKATKDGREIDDDEVKRRLRGMRTRAESLGYGQADLENPQAMLQPSWFLYAQCKRVAYISFVARQQGVEGSWNQIDWITKDRYEALKNGPPPTRRSTNAPAVPAGGAGGGGAFQPPSHTGGAFQPPASGGGFPTQQGPTQVGPVSNGGVAQGQGGFPAPAQQGGFPPAGGGFPAQGGFPAPSGGFPPPAR